MKIGGGYIFWDVWFFFLAFRFFGGYIVVIEVVFLFFRVGSFGFEGVFLEV